MELLPSTSVLTLLLIVVLSCGGVICSRSGGDQHLKFLQQVMAAEYAGVALDYSTFKNEKLCRELTELARLCSASGVSIAQLVKYFESAPQGWSEDPFGEWIVKQLNKIPALPLNTKKDTAATTTPAATTTTPTDSAAGGAAKK